MAIPRDYDLPVTESEYANLVARDTVTRHITQTAMYQITPQDDAIRKRGDEAFRIARERMDAWHRLWEQATTPEAKAAVEAQAAKEEARMRKYRVIVAKNRKSNHFRTRFALADLDLTPTDAMTRKVEQIDKANNARFGISKVHYEEFRAMGYSYGERAQQRGVRRIVDDKEYTKALSVRLSGLGIKWDDAAGMKAHKVADEAWAKGWHAAMFDEVENPPKFSVGDSVGWNIGTRIIRGSVARVNRLAKPEPEYIVNLMETTSGRKRLNIPESSLVKMSRFSHNISLPRTKRRLNIDEASAALSQMGYRIGNVRYDAAISASIYKITQPNGAVIEVPATKIADFVYGRIKNLNAQRYSDELIRSLLPFEQEQIRNEGYKVYEVEICMPEIGCNHYETVAAKDVRDAVRIGKAHAKNMKFNEVTKVNAKELHMNSTGAKAAFASAGEVADFFKTLADVERAEMRGDTAKMRTLLQSVAAMVQRDQAKLPSDALAYYDGLRRKAGMSRTGAKAAFAAWRDGNMEFKTRTLGEDQVQVLVNEGSGWTNAGVVADETEAHDLARGYVANRAKGFVYLGGVWQKAKASRTGAKAAFAHPDDAQITSTHLIRGNGRKYEITSRKPASGEAQNQLGQTEWLNISGANGAQYIVQVFNNKTYRALASNGKAWQGRILASRTGALRDVKKIQHSRKASMKSHFAVTTYEQAEHQIALAEERIRSVRAAVSDTEKWIHRANGAMQLADAGNEMAAKEVISIARMIESAMSHRGFSRTGAKAKHSSYGAFIQSPVTDDLRAPHRFKVGQKVTDAHLSRGATQRVGTIAREKNIKGYPAYVVYWEPHGTPSDELDHLLVKASRTGAKAFNTQGANPARGTYPTSSGASSSRLFSLQQEPNGNLVICKGEAARGFNKVLRVGDMQSMRQELREMSDTDNYSRTGAKAKFSVEQEISNAEDKMYDGNDEAPLMIQDLVRRVNKREITGEQANRVRKLVKEARAYNMYSRTGEKSTNAKPTLDEVMKIANELKKMGLNEVAETLVKSWLRETNGGRNMNSRTDAKSTHAADAVSSEIATLVREGYDQTQAAAIAYDMKRRGEL